MSQKCTYHIWYTWHFVQRSSVYIFVKLKKNKPQEKAASLQTHQLIRTTVNENAPKEMNTKVNHIKKKIEKQK